MKKGGCVGLLRLPLGFGAMADNPKRLCSTSSKFLPRWVGTLARRSLGQNKWPAGCQFDLARAAISLCLLAKKA